MDRIRWIIFAVVCVGILGALIATSGGNPPDVSAMNENAVISEGPIADHVYGNPKAKIVLIEYGDFQCPGCASAYPNVKQIKERYKGDLAFIFRNLPLTSIHPNALAAATAAEAAGRQGKFFEMHDKLYENQKSWEAASADSRGAIFEGYARELGLDIDRYTRDLTSKEVKQKIDRDRALSRKARADSTPTFVLNGLQLKTDNWNSEAALNTTIRTALTRAGVKLPEDGDGSTPNS